MGSLCAPPRRCPSRRVPHETIHWFLALLVAHTAPAMSSAPGIVPNKYSKLDSRFPNQNQALHCW